MDQCYDEGILHDSMPYMFGTLVLGSVKSSDLPDVTTAQVNLKVIKSNYEKFKDVVLKEPDYKYLIDDLNEYLYVIDELHKSLNASSEERSYQIGVYQYYLREKHVNHFVDAANELKKDGKYSCK